MGSNPTGSNGRSQRLENNGLCFFSVLYYFEIEGKRTWTTASANETAMAIAASAAASAAAAASATASEATAFALRPGRRLRMPSDFDENAKEDVEHSLGEFKSECFASKGEIATRCSHGARKSEARTRGCCKRRGNSGECKMAPLAQWSDRWPYEP